MSPRRLTIDVTVARDLLDSDRPRHHLAQRLFDLTRRGDVALAVAPQGHGLDADGDLADRLRELFRHHGVRQPPQLAYVSEATYPSDDLYPRHVVECFSEAWEAVVAGWRSHERKPPAQADRFHVETHVIEGRDVCVTGDEALLTMCARLRDEHGVPIVAMRLSDVVS